MAGILDELLTKLDADAQAKVKAAMTADPTLGQRDASAQDWMRFIVDPAITTPPAVPAVTAAPTNTPAPVTTPAAPVAAPTAPPAAATTSSAPTSAGFDLDKLMSGMKSLIGSELTTLRADLDKKFVPAASVDQFRTDLLTRALKLNDDFVSVREQHRDEFGKPLDRAAFEKHVAAGAYPNMQAAYDSFVQKPRTDLAIKKGIEDGVKQKTSSQSVPAVTKVTSMSPAQQVIAKQKAAAASTNATGSATLDSAITRLKQMNAAREDAGAA